MLDLYLLLLDKIMDDEEENNANNEQHRNRFNEWLRKNLKTNSALLKREYCDRIIRHLKYPDEAIDRKTKRRIKSNGYVLLNYEPLNLIERLFIELKVM